MLESSKDPLEVSGHEVQVEMVIMAICFSPTETDALVEAESTTKDGRDFGYM